MSQQVIQNQSQARRRLPFDAMRVLLVALVVAHHSVMAYLPEAPPVAASLVALPHWWQAFPIVDSAKWSGFSLFVAFNDTFFMAAFFLLSGLFVWGSLHRKGVKLFLRDRTLRLGKAFLFAAFVISPLAYYATYRQISHANPSSGFWKEWFRLGSWPAGPAWFLWVLLAFDLLAAGLFRFAPEATRTSALLIKRLRPVSMFLLLAALSALCFTPMALHFGSMSWSTFGPFSLQTSRIFLYLAYFAAGVLGGATGLETSFLQNGNLLARRWWLWSAWCLLSFLLMVGLAVVATRQPASVAWGVIVSTAFCFSCASSTFAVFAVLLRFVTGKGRAWVMFASAAFGIYLVHYAFVSWLQYAFLRIAASAVVKATCVTGGAMILSLGVVLAWSTFNSRARSSRRADQSL